MNTIIRVFKQLLFLQKKCIKLSNNKYKQIFEGLKGWLAKLQEQEQIIISIFCVEFIQ